MSPLLLHSNTNQCNINGLLCILHRDVSHTVMLQPHFISCRGVSRAGGNMRGSRIFCQFYLVLSLFYSLQSGSNGFIAEKTILILYQGSRGSPLFIRGCPTFPGGRGPNAIFQGDVQTPYPLWICTWAMSS